MSTSRSPDTLTLVSATRAGGAHRAERRYQDFKIGRRRLTDLIKVGDRASVLGWLPRELERLHCRQLLLETPSALASGRVPLYLCPECADLGCGAVTVTIHRAGDLVTWSGFHHEGPIDDATPVEPVRELRDFTFAWQAYRDALAGFR